MAKHGKHGVDGLYAEIEAAAMADDFEGLYSIAASASRQEFIRILDRLVGEGHSAMGMARDVLRDRRLTRDQERAIMILSAFCLGSMIRVENALPYTFKALRVDRSSVEYDDVEGYSVKGDTVSMSTSNIDQAASMAKLQFLINHIIETIAANSVSTKRDCYYMLKNQFQKYPWMDLDGQGESDRLIGTLERIIRMQRENLNITADPKGLIYGDIVLVDEEGKEFSCKEREQSITGLAGQWEVKSYGVKALVAIEKTGVFMDLKKLKVADGLKIGLIHLGGQPARGCRALISLLSCKGIPIGVLTDLSPWSGMIAKSVLSGSIASAHLRGLHAPGAAFLGIESSDVDSWLKDVWKGVQEPLSDLDLARARNNLSLPYMQDGYWKGENSWFIRNGKKTELEALGTAAGSPLKKKSFYEKYIRAKLKEKLGVKV
ncbi:DNA topoisomerase IV subunit A [Methanocella conradii]|uniref:DNA topoisomerase IV subunit A n=1 Tax=Methanocella conradii TaxID=1175444 RepID=UPI0024B38955|nr:DNA topoisomerase IV subunit A [Methanocella conradii]MDI6897810.1 DNA topoisomerase IV subunit A [Methanocella conradii]